MRVRTLLNPLGCLQRFPKRPWPEIFPDFNGNLDVEVGFGSGSFLAHYAPLHPNRSVVGFEIRKQMVGIAQRRIDELKLSNVYLGWGNANYGLMDMFDDGSVDRIFVFHPDPWPKPKQRKRRLVNLEFLTLVASKLKPNGQLFIATDVPEVWESILETIKISNLFQIVADDAFWEAHYKTRWKEMSLERQRSLFYATFTKISPTNHPEGSL